ncbi:MAG: hypothetical protein R3E77_08705 [Steroidobacteraceae bacterium]
MGEPMTDMQLGARIRAALAASERGIRTPGFDAMLADARPERPPVSRKVAWAAAALLAVALGWLLLPGTRADRVAIELRDPMLAQTRSPMDLWRAPTDSLLDVYAYQPPSPLDLGAIPNPFLESVL